MNKKTKKLKATNLPNFSDWQNAYYKKHPEDIALLKQEIIAEFNDSPDMPVEVLLSVLRRIAQLEGMTKIARKTSLNRVSLYRALSAKGNPSVQTLGKVASCMGYRLTLTPIDPLRP